MNKTPVYVKWFNVSNILPPKDLPVLVAKEFFGPGDWRIKIGGINEDEDTGWKVFGGSWIPSHWAYTPEPPSKEIDTPDTIFGFNRDDLLAVADGLESGYEDLLDVGSGKSVQSSTSYAAEFIRAVLSQT